MLELLRYVALSVIISMLICGAISSVQSKSGSSTKWITFTDPYNRYSIKYPSKWTVETEPVHNKNSLYEVPLKLSGQGSVLIVRDMGSTNGLTLREYASYYRSNVEDQVSVVKSYPITCGNLTPQPSVNTCYYQYISEVGVIPIVTVVQIYSTSDKVLFVTFIFGVGPKKLPSMDNVFFMFNSFRILGIGGVADETSYSKTSIPPVFRSMTDNFTAYQNPIYGIKIRYPSDWRLTEQLTNGIFVVQFFSPAQNESDKFLDNVNIAIENLNDHTNLAQYSDKSFKVISTNTPEFHFISSNTVNVNGMPAIEKVFTVKQSGLDLNMKQIYILNNEKAYVFTYAAEMSNYNKYLQTVQKILDSLIVN